jgi:hypothetical protein
VLLGTSGGEVKGLVQIGSGMDLYNIWSSICADLQEIAHLVVLGDA